MNCVFRKIAIVLILIIFCKLNSEAQLYELKLTPPKMPCRSTYLYYGFDNPVKLVAKSPDAQLSAITLRSDSILIRKINDSMYTMRPLYQNVWCRVMFTDSVTSKAYGTYGLYCHQRPLSFVLTPGFNPHSHSVMTAISDMKKLYLSYNIKKCFDWMDDYKIESFQLTLVRGTSVLLSYDLEGDIIPPSVKKEILELALEGDMIRANDIRLRSKKDTMVVKNHGLLVF